VHVPLKPHKCDFCGKSFKRPQDLKKHVKTHADDSVLSNSPGQGQNGRGSLGGNGGITSNGQGRVSMWPVFGLPQLSGFAVQSSYYPSHDGPMGNPYPAYQPAMSSNGQNGPYSQQANNQYGGYGSVSYPNNSIGDLQSTDTRRRAVEALNDFLGDIKRRAINPSNYYDVGQRLGGGNALPLPIGSGYNTGYNNSHSGGAFGNFNTASLLESFNNGDMGGGGLQNAIAQAGFSLPMSNARTKNDLQEIDRFLEQLQATVYETSNQAAAAGVQQPGVHATFTSDYGFGSNHQYSSRTSNSPPSYQTGTQAGASFGAMTAATVPSSGANDTPALTPASVSSYSSSGHSPMSSHGRASLSSMNGSAMYPNLPAVTGMSDLSAGYPSTTSAPASGLASGFDGFDGRRYSGSRLQRQAPSQDVEMQDVDDGGLTPKQSDAKRSKSKGNSSIDPALRGEDLSDGPSTPAARSENEDKRQEDWIENIRTIESLRKWVSERLARGDYEDDGEEIREGAGSDDDAAKSIAKMVEARIAGGNVKSEPGDESEVKYPALPSRE